jgi:hypothetical protein
MKFPASGRTIFFVLAFFCQNATLLRAAPSTWPDAADPLAGMGICANLFHAKVGELEMLSAAGFRWVRSDCVWQAIEKKPGVYDFSTYDCLLSRLEPHHIRAVLILDYGNPLYDEGMSPHTDSGRAAYARWAVATVTHFRGRGVIWEIWNEPNLHFWRPKPNAEDYAKLAVTASDAIHKVAPEEIIVGPALGEDHLDFLEVALRGGILNDWAGITLHPYYRRGPETYGILYDKTKALLPKYAPVGKKIEVMCGESGYSVSWYGVHDDSPAWISGVNAISHLLTRWYAPLAITDKIQGEYFARLNLFNVLSSVPLTMWYDWRDDGKDPSNEEHNFGIVRHDYFAGRAEVYDRKPAYDAALTYTRELTGFRFKERVPTASPTDFVLSFAKDGEERLVAWTSDWAIHPATFFTPSGSYDVTSFDGKTRSSVIASGGTLTLLLDGGPQYLSRRNS